jgi:4-amino-4-deoxy-L-arabinose transferase-like glycosyltransferase
LTSTLPPTSRLVPVRGLLVLLAGTFVLKAIVLSQLRDHPLLAPESGLDTTAYVRLAERVLAGHVGLGPGLYYVSPFYIYFLAAALAVFHSFTAVRVVQIALGTAAVAFVFLMSRQWFGERAAWIAAVLAAFTGLFTFYEILILQSSVDAFFTAAALFFLARGLSRRTDLPPKGGSYLQISIAGIIWGVQTLNRPNVLIAVIGVAIVMALVQRRVRPAALLVTGLLIGMAPVAIRNVVVSGEWTLVSSHGGLNFYIGNNPNATGFYQHVPGVTPSIVGQEKDTRRIASQGLGHPATDAEASSYFFGLAWTWIREHPLHAVALFLKKFAFAFHASHVPLPHSYAFFAYDTPGILRFLVVGPWLLAPLGLLGLALRCQKVAGTFPEKVPAAFLIWAAFVPLYAASVALFFVADRYRLPLMVPLCVCAGGAADFAIVALRTQRMRALGIAGVAFVALFAATNIPVTLDEGRWTEGLRTAERYVIAGRYDEAEHWALWLEAHGPAHPGAGLLGVAQQMMALNQHDRALPYLVRAHDADPNEPRADYALGQALLKTGRAAEAIPHLRHGFEGKVDLPAGGFDYARALVDAGDLAGAAAAIRRIRPADTADADAWLRLGRLAMEAKAPDAAEPFFRRAAEMQPGDAATRQQYGLNLLVQNRFDEAARELSEAARLDPRDADTLSRLAYSEAKLGRTDEARRHAQAALTLNPQDLLASQLLAALR